MILVDANLLLYAKVRDFPQHELAKAWLDERLNDVTGVGLPWQSLLAFVRLASNPRIFQRPLPASEAWVQVEEWLACRNVWVVTFFLIPDRSTQRLTTAHMLLGSILCPQRFKIK